MPNFLERGDKLCTTVCLFAMLVLLGCIAAGAGQARSPESLMALGRHLSQECTSCHRNDGVHNGIPSIAGLDPAYFVETLNLYRRGERTNPVMVSVAQSLDDEQIAALSLYFGSLPKPTSAKAEN